MEHVYVDTALLAVPNYAVDEATAAELIERVLHFAALVEPEVPLNVVLSSKAEDDLWSQHCGPGFEEIEQFIGLMGIGHLFSARDLAVLYQALLDRSVRSDAIAPIEVQQYSNFSTAPALPDGLSPVDLTAETERILSTLAALGVVEAGWHFGSGLNSPAATLEVSTTVECATGDHIDVLKPFPSTVVQPVQTLAHASELISQQASRRIWERADTPEQLHFAITLGSLDILRCAGREPEPNALIPFSIGPGFMDSLAACQCAAEGRYSGAALALCCQLVSATSSRAIGQFGRPAQDKRTFDGALGWRVHLTKGHEGLRLMYWQNGGQLEFANVGAKHELWISLGRPGAAVSPSYGSVLSRS